MPHTKTRGHGISESSGSEGDGLRPIMLEVRGLGEQSADAAERTVESMSVDGCWLDRDFEPVRMEESGTWIIRCYVKNDKVADDLRKHANVVAVWKDTEIAPFGNIGPHQ